MNSISENKELEKAYNEIKRSESISSFLKFCKVSGALKSAGAYKAKGTPVIEVIVYLIGLLFTNRSMFMSIGSKAHNAPFHKDVVYRLLNSQTINWVAVLMKSAANAINRTLYGLTSESRIKTLIVDDSMYERTRSKKVELLANVFDHAEKGKDKYKRGFRLLTVLWSDGVTSLPLAFRHMSSNEQKNRYVEMSNKTDKRTNGFRARKEAVSSMPDVLIGFLKKIRMFGIPATHLLFDAWFSSPSGVINAKKTGFDVVSRLKDTPNVKYLFDGKEKALRQIYSGSKKRRGMSKYLLSVAVEVFVRTQDKKGYVTTVPAKIVFVRNKKNRKEWIALISTDTSLSEEQIIQLYGRRWNIEVFFKMCKSHLGLGKEFQGLSYDCITAHTAVVMLRYRRLALDKRINEDPRSMGELAIGMYDEMRDIRFSEALELVFRLLNETLEGCLFLSDGEVREIIDIFFDKVSLHFSIAFKQKSA